MKTAFMAMAIFNGAAGIWLAVMENILRHPGYGQRILVALCIVVQSIVTLLGRGRVLHMLVLIGAAAIGYVGVSSLVRLFQSTHFEGFVLVIGSALIAQCVLTFIALLGPTIRQRPTLPLQPLMRG